MLPLAGLSAFDMFTQWDPTNIVMWILTQILFAFLQNVITPLASQLFTWELDYTQIPYVNSVILWLQAFSAIAVVAVRVAIGIKDKILLAGGDNEISASEYIFKSIAAVVVVALMPTLCALIIRFGHSMYVDLTGGTGADLSSQLAWFSMGNSSLDAFKNISNQELMNFFWVLVAVLLITILTIACGYQFLKRQVQMVTISIIGPIVSIYSATEDDTNQVMNLLKNLFGLCCVQWLQYVLVTVALGVGEGWMVQVLSDLTFLAAGPFSATESIQMFLYSIAWFGAALTVPALVDNYTYGNGASHAGTAAVGAMVRMGVRSPKAAARGAATAAKTVVTKVPVP